MNSKKQLKQIKIKRQANKLRTKITNNTKVLKKDIHKLQTLLKNLG